MIHHLLVRNSYYFWRTCHEIERDKKRALVLGVAGVAWELGILLGLYDRGVDVGDADIIIGTSAGSVDGAHLSSRFDLESLFTTHPTPVEQTKERKVEFDPTQLMEASRQAVAGAGLDPKAIREHIGADALAVPSTPEAERRAIIETWLPVHTWPGQRMLIWHVGMIALILNPLGANTNYIGAGIDSEVVVLEREGSRVLVIAPDAASTTAFGLNPRDLEARRPSALAGRALGRELATSVAALWSRTSSGRASPNFKYKWDS